MNGTALIRIETQLPELASLMSTSTPFSLSRL